MKQLLSLLVAVFLSIGLAFGAVNVNTATQAELETLKGIGPAKAKAIIDHRTKHGPFKSFEDLDKVSGIGEGTIGRIKSEVTFSGKTTVTAADKSSTSKESSTKASTDKTAKQKRKIRSQTQRKSPPLTVRKPARTRPLNRKKQRASRARKTTRQSRLLTAKAPAERWGFFSSATRQKSVG